jgi:hypothetical protein
MNITRRTLLIGASAALVPYSFMSKSAQAADDGFDVAAAISTAATKADHEKIAAFYEQQATELDTKVAQHKKMSAAYRHAGKGKHSGIPMDSHCDELIKSYQRAADGNRDLAKSHRDMAAKAP